MNIFVLDENPEVAAQMHCDKHVVKMVLEAAQMLSAAYPPGSAPYRRTHYNHPCTAWTRQTKENFDWTVRYGRALAKEYTRRYGKTHKCLSVIDWCDKHSASLDFEENGLTEHPQCLPSECKRDNVVEAYRAYYIEHKATFAKWNKAKNPPHWWPEQKENSDVAM